MTVQSEELLEKIRQQFDFGPYPRIPIDAAPPLEPQRLFNLNWITPYYMRYQRLPKVANLSILDVGCGTGYKALGMWKANPGAKIVGIDISPKSIELAQQRFEFNQIPDATFQVLDVAELSQLNQQFDYINCDELLYLFPNPAEVLGLMRQVLKPQGIIHSNLHSSLQRAAFFRAQEMFRLMGLMDENPEETEIQLALEILKSLKPEVDLRRRTYPNDQDLAENVSDQDVLMNLLFQGDKGYTITELFSYLREAGLEFISMINPRQWEILDLFKNVDDLPVFVAMGLDEIEIEDRLRLFELIHPRHRLLDFWCGHPVDASEIAKPASAWGDGDWSEATIQLHPQLATDAIKQFVVEAIASGRGCNLGKFLPLNSGIAPDLSIPLMAAILPLWDGPQTLSDLVSRYARLYPIDPLTGDPVDVQEAQQQIQGFLLSLEVLMYLLLEPGA